MFRTQINGARILAENLFDVILFRILKKKKLWNQQSLVCISTFAHYVIQQLQSTELFRCPICENNIQRFGLVVYPLRHFNWWTSRRHLVCSCNQIFFTIWLLSIGWGSSLLSIGWGRVFSVLDRCVCNNLVIDSENQQTESNFYLNSEWLVLLDNHRQECKVLCPTPVCLKINP